MSSPCEVLIGILALLQRKTLIKHKNRTLKFLKRHYLIVRSMKNVAVLTEDGAFAIQGKKNANVQRGQPDWGGGGWGEVAGRRFN